MLEATQSRRSRQEMEDMRAQQVQQEEREKITLVKNLKTVAQIEDEFFRRMSHGVPLTTAVKALCHLNQKTWDGPPLSKRVLT
jgi:hypothetical protein